MCWIFSNIKVNSGFVLGGHAATDKNMAEHKQVQKFSLFFLENIRYNSYYYFHPLPLHPKVTMDQDNQQEEQRKRQVLF